MDKLVIGFCGYAGAGKDTAARAISEYINACGGRPQIFSFADPMRAMLLALRVPIEYITNRDLKEQPIPGFGRSYRQLAQTLGTEWGRALHGEDFWINALAARVEANNADTVLLPDVRFPNEAAWIKAAGGVLIRVNRPGVIPVHPHESERHVTEFQPYAELYNTESQARLEYDAVELFRNIVQVRVLDRTLQGGQA